MSIYKKLRELELDKIALTFLLLFSGLIFFFWDYIEKLYPGLTVKDVVGILITVCGSCFYMMDSKINKLLKKDNLDFLHLSLADAFKVCADEIKYINTLRINALTSGLIQPLFASSNINAEECIILLYKSDSGNDKNQNIDVDIMIDNWNALKLNGRIKKLTIKTVNYRPTNYYLIFDERFIIFGLLTPSLNTANKFDVDDPLLIKNNSKDGALVIKKFTMSFDLTNKTTK